MALIASVNDKTRIDVLENVYFRIPRTQSEHFYDWFSEKHLAFPVQLWRNKETRDLKDDGLEPFRTINVRINNCTQEDIDGIPGVPGVHKDGIIISDPIPPVIGRKETWLPDEVEFAFDSVFDEDRLKTDIAENLLSGNSISESIGLAVVSQVYEYINTLEDFGGIDMREATRG